MDGFSGVCGMQCQMRGYYCDAKTADEFYSKVAVEIETAFEEGSTIIEKQKTMPSALMSPWREGYFSKIVENYAENYRLCTAL